MICTPNSLIVGKICGEEDGENRQMQSILLFKQTNQQLKLILLWLMKIDILLLLTIVA